MINKHPPVNGFSIRIPIIIPLKGGGLLIGGLGYPATRSREPSGRVCMHCTETERVLCMSALSLNLNQAYRTIFLRVRLGPVAASARVFLD